MGRWPVHPVLVGVWPVLLLWAENAGEVGSREALPVLIWMLLVALLGTAAASLLLRDLRRGSLVASGGLVLYALYGRVGGDGLHPALGVALVALLVAGMALLVMRLREARVEAVTGVANVVALALVAVSLPAVIDAAASSGPRPVRATPDPATTADGGVTPTTRDIFYVVLDRYPRQDTLAEVFDHDNGPFLRELERQGLQVAQRSLANYPKTAHSLAASLNLDYLDHLEAAVPPGRADDWGPVYAMLDDHRVGEILTDAGYRYTHIGNWWSPTKEAASADRVLNYGTRSEFAEVYDRTTLLPSIRSLVGAEGDLSDRELIRNHTLYAFDRLDDLARQDPVQPRFVFAHITVPHEPYVFAADGSYVTEEQAAERSRERNIVEQVRYANLRIGALVGALLDHPPDEQPIVVIQSDEGPHPAARTGPDYQWLQAPRPVLREKLRILNAYHLPGTDVEVGEDITPVNTFRLILDAYLGTDYGRLPDRAYVFPDESHLYDFTEVTARVR